MDNTFKTRMNDEMIDEMNDEIGDEIDYKNNPLHGIGTKKMLVELSDHYGFDILFAYLNINCFNSNPSVASSVKFLKKTDWAREKVEGFYLYTFKNLPKVSHDQYNLSPRDRIVPADQQPGEPAELSLEDAQQLREKREIKSAEYDAKSSSGVVKHSTANNDNQKTSTPSDESERPALNPWGNPWP